MGVPKDASEEAEAMLETVVERGSDDRGCGGIVEAVLERDKVSWPDTSTSAPLGRDRLRGSPPLHAANLSCLRCDEPEPELLARSRKKVLAVSPHTAAALGSSKPSLGPR